MVFTGVGRRASGVADISRLGRCGSGFLGWLRLVVVVEAQTGPQLGHNCITLRIISYIGLNA